MIDQSGRIIKQLMLQPGVNNINVQALASGTYFVRVKHADGTIVNQKFVKQ
jgi:hypothetical protein